MRLALAPRRDAPLTKRSYCWCRGRSGRYFDPTGSARLCEGGRTTVGAWPRRSRRTIPRHVRPGCRRGGSVVQGDPDGYAPAAAAYPRPRRLGKPVRFTHARMYDGGAGPKPGRPLCWALVRRRLYRHYRQHAAWGGAWGDTERVAARPGELARSHERGMHGDVNVPGVEPPPRVARSHREC